MSPTSSNSFISSIISPALPSSTSSSSSSSSTMVLSLNIIRSSFIFVILSAIIMSHIETTTAKSLGLTFDDDFWSQPEQFSKRNSWWSKKSVDSSPNYETLLPESDPFVDEDKLPQEEKSISKSSPGDVSILYDCYVQTCVPNFVRCTQTSRARETFEDCKATHRLCALRCWVASTEMAMDGI